MRPTRPALAVSSIVPVVARALTNTLELLFFLTLKLPLPLELTGLLVVLVLVLLALLGLLALLVVGSVLTGFSIKSVNL